MTIFFDWDKILNWGIIYFNDFYGYLFSGALLLAGWGIILFLMACIDNDRQRMWAGIKFLIHVTINSLAVLLAYEVCHFAIL